MRSERKSREKKQMDLSVKSEGTLVRMRGERLAKLGQLGAMVAGSVVRVRERNAYYLTDKVRQKTRTIVLTKEVYKEAVKWNATYREAKRLLEELDGIQRALIVLKVQEERRGR